MPTADNGASREPQRELIVVLGAVDETYEADERIRTTGEWLGGNGLAVLHATIGYGEVCPLIGRVQHQTVGIGRLQIGIAALIGVSVDINRRTGQA